MATDTARKHYPIRQKWSVRRFWPTGDWFARYVTIPEAAQRLNVSDETIIRWFDQHKLAVCKLGNHPEPHVDLREVSESGLLDAPESSSPQPGK